MSELEQQQIAELKASRRAVAEQLKTCQKYNHELEDQITELKALPPPKPPVQWEWWVLVLMLAVIIILIILVRL